MTHQSDDERRRHLAVDETILASDADAFDGKTVQVDEGEILSAGSHLDRFVIEDFLGAGGMGSVYVAYDPQLDRRVALKILHGGSHTRKARVWLITEAKMMARLSHPHVVTVYEVGTTSRHFFIAMEYVKGRTLRQWRDESQRHWKEIVHAHLQAGYGLTAAHLAGIVHRDFKPANILIGEDERVRVTDFGIAKATEYDVEPLSQSTSFALEPTRRAGPALEAPDWRRRADTGNITLVGDRPDTRGGVFHGTIYYVAPEIFEGGAPTARSDQYSFCITLWESLFGKPPYTSSSLVQLQLKILKAELPKFPSEPPIPRKLQKVLRRGLSRHPGQRFPSMQALLDELERTVRPRRVLAPLVLAAALLVSLGTAGFFWLQQEKTVATCDGGPEKIEETWNETRRSETREAFAEADQSNADEIFEVVDRELSSYATSWAAAHNRACSETRIEKTHSEELMLRRIACLEKLQNELDALIRLFVAPEHTALPRYVAAVFDLTPVESCERPSDELDTPEHLLEPITEIQRQLAEATAYERAGLYQEGLKFAKKGYEKAAQLDHKPTLAEALLVKGRLQWKAGELQESREALLRVTELGEEISIPETKLRALIELVWVSGFELAELDEAKLWQRLAEAALRSMDPKSRVLQARLYDYAAAGMARHREKPDFPRVEEMMTEALGLRIQEYGRAHPDVAMTHTKLAIMYLRWGKLDKGEEHAREAISICEETGIRHHPNFAFALNNLGSILATRGEIARAEKAFKKALEVGERALGKDHSEVAVFLSNVGAMATQRGAYDEALPLLERSLAIDKKQLGPNHVRVAESEDNLSATYELANDLTKAKEHCLRSLRIRAANWGEEDPRVARYSAQCSAIGAE